MKFDNLLMFTTTAESVIIAAGSGLFSKSIDARAVGTPPIGGPLKADFGGAPADLWIVLIIGTAWVQAANSVTLQVVQADDGPLTTNLQVLRQSPAMTVTGGVLATAGKVLNFGQVPNLTKRFFGLRLIVTTSNVTAGTVTAGLCKGFPSNAASLGSFNT